MKRELLRIVGLISSIVFIVGLVHAQSPTEFTYQGKLINTGTSTTNYDFEFRLYDGTPTLLGTLQRPNVPVSNGVFVVKLDFGNQFTGAPRYLEISVRNAGSGSFTTLSPRQQITSAPYNIRSLSAANADQLGGIGAGGFIQNTTSQQPANFNISGNGIIAGNVGIGTSTPSSKLFVNGTGIIRANVNSDWNAGLGLKLNDQPKWSVATVAPGQFQIYNDAIGANALWIDPTNNNVGIGTNSPNAKLEVSGSGIVRARVNSDSDARLTLSVNNVPKWSVQSITDSNGNNYFGIWNEATGTSAIDVFPTSNVVEIKHFRGGGDTLVCHYFGQLAYCSSSLRYKTNIAPFGSGLNLVKQLSPITFNWKEGGKKDFGLGAEDVEKIEPLLVSYNDKGEVEGVKYDRIAVVAINAIKEQQAEIESLKNQVAALDSLRQEVAALKALLCTRKKNADICRK